LRTFAKLADQIIELVGSNLLGAGVPEPVAMSVTGIKRGASFDRYDIVSDRSPAGGGPEVRGERCARRRGHNRGHI
jgi:hypothetical protein